MRINGIQEMILEWNAEFRRRKGKPREQWKDIVRESMISKNFTEEDEEARDLWWKNKISLG